MTAEQPWKEKMGAGIFCKGKKINGPFQSDERAVGIEMRGFIKFLLVTQCFNRI